MSLKSKIKKGVGATLSEQAVNVAVQLLQVPLFLLIWGKGIYSEWIVVFSIPSFLAISDFGFSKAAINTMTIANSQKDYNYFNKIFSNIKLVNFALAIFIIIIIGIAIIISPDDMFVKMFHYIKISDVRYILFYLSVYGVLSLQNSLYYGVLSSTDRFSLSVYLSSILKTVEFLVIAFSLGILSVSVEKLALILCVFSCVRTLFLIVFIQQKIKHISEGFFNGFKLFSLDIIKSLLKPALGFMMFPLGNAIKLQASINILGYYAPGTAVIIFSTARILVNFCSQILHLLVRPFLPEMSVMFGNSDFPKLRSIHNGLSSIGFVVSILFSLGLLATFPFVLKIWTHNEVPSDYIILSLLLIANLFGSFSLTSSYFLYSFNKHFKISILFVVYNVVSMLAALLFTYLFGLYGVGMSLVLLEVLYSYSVVKVSNFELGQSFKEWVKDSFFLTKGYLAKFYNR